MEDPYWPRQSLIDAGATPQQADDLILLVDHIWKGYHWRDRQQIPVHDTHIPWGVKTRYLVAAWSARPSS